MLRHFYALLMARHKRRYATSAATRFDIDIAYAPLAIDSYFR